jgi:CTP synthase (UTP-ammonia lyase)
MSEVLKIAIIGDYNFTYNAHHATNLSLDHASDFLETEVNYYWIKINEAIQHKRVYFEQFDGIWIAPGPFLNHFFLNGVYKLVLESNVPVFLTGEGYKYFFEHLISTHQLNPYGEKLISDNLIEGNQFERVTIYPKTKDVEKLYENCNHTELSSSRFSLYPQLTDQLNGYLIDIEATNQFDDPEIVTLKNHPFFMACSFCPQISSTRDLPHPLIYTFLKMAIELSSSKFSQLV